MRVAVLVVPIRDTAFWPAGFGHSELSNRYLGEVVLLGEELDQS